jgi:hypothetical protein
MIAIAFVQRLRSVTMTTALLTLVTSAESAAVEAQQWRITELTFHAERDYTDPFDFEAVAFVVEFVGPGGRELVVPGFWDGDRTWRARFTPTAPGKWTYTTRCRDVRDGGLHGRRGSVTVAPPSGTTALRRHGGFLRASENGRYLTYSDGAPFFWLGDTWWNVPSGLVSFDRFEAMVDRRVSQGFSVFQAHGYTGFEPDPERTAFDVVRDVGETAVRFWREVDRYYSYAERRGLVGIIGFAATDALDRVSLPDLKRLWHYYLARYAAYPITFLFTQEYNAEIGDKRGRIEKILALGRFVRDIDPYRRALSVHPWVRTKDGREAWKEAWYAFVLLQAGHFVNPVCDPYLSVHETVPARPFIESETNYEGFSRKDFQVDAAVVRRSAYTAMQCGAAGFTYGAQGLYAGISTKDEPATTANWGPILTWEEGLALPGGAQMAHLRRLYESLDWWRSAPWPASEGVNGALARSVGEDVVVVYLPSATRQRDEIKLAGFERSRRYRAEWFDPRTGAFARVAEALSVDRGELRLPTAPSLGDWVLVARVESEGAKP